MYRAMCVLAVCLILFGISCAGLGTSVRVLRPEALPTIKTVAIWPIAAVPLTSKPDAVILEWWLWEDPAFRDEAEYVSETAEGYLYNELLARGLFSLIEADSILAVVFSQNHDFFRFGREDWREYAEGIEAETLALTEVTFGNEAGGVNTYVKLHLCDVASGDTLIVVTFNTKWGKSYLGTEPMSVTMPDAIHGVVNGLMNELKKYPALTSR